MGLRFASNQGVATLSLRNHTRQKSWGLPSAQEIKQMKLSNAPAVLDATKAINPQIKSASGAQTNAEQKRTFAPT